MMFFKKIGIVKNLNFKVGHTGIVLLKRASGELHFYDFGRYVSPRGYGRARSKFSDPRLEITLRTTFADNRIANLEAIAAHLETMKDAMYGQGRLFFSIATGIDFDRAKAYGDRWVHRGSYPYGAIAPNSNNCSRFIARMLIRSSKKHTRCHGINLPETVKASPMSNVVNAVEDRMIYGYTPEGGLVRFRMDRRQSFLFLLKQLGDNLSHQKSTRLPDDRPIGAMASGTRPEGVPEDARYLGGVGDGAWFSIRPAENGRMRIERFTSKGELEYAVMGEPMQPLNLNEPYQVTYDSHLLFTHLQQNGRKIRVRHF